MGYPAEADWPDIKKMPEYPKLQQDFKKAKWVNGVGRNLRIVQLWKYQIVVSNGQPEIHGPTISYRFIEHLYLQQNAKLEMDLEIAPLLK